MLDTCFVLVCWHELLFLRRNFLHQLILTAAEEKFRIRQMKPPLNKLWNSIKPRLTAHIENIPEHKPKICIKINNELCGPYTPTTPSFAFELLYKPLTIMLNFDLCKFFEQAPKIRRTHLDALQKEKTKTIKPNTKQIDYAKLQFTHFTIYSLITRPIKSKSALDN